MSKFLEILNKIPKRIKSFNRLSMGIAAVIDDSLKFKGWTQKKLSEELNKKESEISKYLSGKHNFTIKTISKLEEVLDKKIIFTEYDFVNRPSFGLSFNRKGYKHIVQLKFHVQPTSFHKENFEDFIKLFSSHYSLNVSQPESQKSELSVSSSGELIETQCVF